MWTVYVYDHVVKNQLRKIVNYILEQLKTEKIFIIFFYCN